ncbi:hypothetical protein FHS96_003641 [Sphingomonas zeicaulis]|uniref:hypothetical protein n=1 Tax=Sphingomonas zeicaulis TaxID=1632740 RepID=UPI003D24CF5A
MGWEMSSSLPMRSHRPLTVRSPIFRSSVAPFDARIVEERRLITGQNPASAEPLVRVLLAQLDDSGMILARDGSAVSSPQ